MKFYSVYACMGRAGPILLILLALGSSAFAQQEACPVKYNTKAQSDKHSVQPLLLGGVFDQCQSGCQPRTDAWSTICKADPDDLSIINVCENSQRAAILEVADKISNGAIRDFSPCELYSFLGNRTLWVIGDSHTKNMFNAMRCLLIDFWDHNVGECAASNIMQLQQQLEKAALRGHIYNTPPRCLHLFGGGRVCLVHSPMGTTLLNDDPLDPGALQLLHTFFAASHDIFYISFGRWHSNNCDGIDAAYTESLETVGAYLQEQRSTFPNVFFAPSMHDHTICTNGVFNETLPYCVPASEGGYSPEIGRNLQKLAYDIMTVQHGIPTVSSYQASVLLYNGHVMPRQTISGKADCLHFCRPGMPEIEMWHMTKAFEEHNISRGVYLPMVPQYRCYSVQPQSFKPFGALNPGFPNPSATPPPAAAVPAPSSEDTLEDNINFESGQQQDIKPDSEDASHSSTGDADASDQGPTWGSSAVVAPTPAAPSPPRAAPFPAVEELIAPLPVLLPAHPPARQAPPKAPAAHSTTPSTPSPAAAVTGQSPSPLPAPAPAAKQAIEKPGSSTSSSPAPENNSDQNAQPPAPLPAGSPQSNAAELNAQQPPATDGKASAAEGDTPTEADTTHPQQQQQQQQLQTDMTASHSSTDSSSAAAARSEGTVPGAAAPANHATAAADTLKPHAKKPAELGGPVTPPQPPAAGRAGRSSPAQNHAGTAGENAGSAKTAQVQPGTAAQLTAGDAAGSKTSVRGVGSLLPASTQPEETGSVLASSTAGFAMPEATVGVAAADATAAKADSSSGSELTARQIPAAATAPTAAAVEVLQTDEPKKQAAAEQQQQQSAPRHPRLGTQPVPAPAESKPVPAQQTGDPPRASGAQPHHTGQAALPRSLGPVKGAARAAAHQPASSATQPAAAAAAAAGSQAAAPAQAVDLAAVGAAAKAAATVAPMLAATPPADTAGAAGAAPAAPVAAPVATGPATKTAVTDAPSPAGHEEQLPALPAYPPNAAAVEDAAVAQQAQATSVKAPATGQSGLPAASGSAATAYGTPAVPLTATPQLPAGAALQQQTSSSEQGGQQDMQTAAAAAADLQEYQDIYHSSSGSSGSSSSTSWGPSTGVLHPVQLTHGSDAPDNIWHDVPGHSTAGMQYRTNPAVGTAGQALDEISQQHQQQQQQQLLPQQQGDMPAWAFSSEPTPLDNAFWFNAPSNYADELYAAEVPLEQQQQVAGWPGQAAPAMKPEHAAPTEQPAAAVPTPLPAATASGYSAAYTPAAPVHDMTQPGAMQTDATGGTGVAVQLPYIAEQASWPSAYGPSGTVQAAAAAGQQDPGLSAASSAHASNMAPASMPVYNTAETQTPAQGVLPSTVPAAYVAAVPEGAPYAAAGTAYAPVPEQYGLPLAAAQQMVYDTVPPVLQHVMDLTDVGVTSWGTAPQPDWASGYVSGADMGNVVSNMQSNTAMQSQYGAMYPQQAVQAVQPAPSADATQGQYTAMYPPEAVQAVQAVLPADAAGQGQYAMLPSETQLSSSSDAAPLNNAAIYPAEPTQASPSDADAAQAQYALYPADAMQGQQAAAAADPAAAMQAVQAVQSADAAGAVQIASVPLQAEPVMPVDYSNQQTQPGLPSDASMDSGDASGASAASGGALEVAYADNHLHAMNDPVLTPLEESGAANSLLGQELAAPQLAVADHQLKEEQQQQQQQQLDLVPMGAAVGVPMVTPAAAAAPKPAVDAALPRKMSGNKAAVPTMPVPDQLLQLEDVYVHPPPVKYSGYITMFNYKDDIKNQQQQQQPGKPDGDSSSNSKKAASGSSTAGNRLADGKAVDGLTGAGPVKAAEVQQPAPGLVLNNAYYRQQRTPPAAPAPAQQQHQQQHPSPKKEDAEPVQQHLRRDEPPASAPRRDDAHGQAGANMEEVHKKDDEQKKEQKKAASATLGAAAGGGSDLDVLVDGHLMIENPWQGGSKHPGSSSGSGKGTSSSMSGGGSSSSKSTTSGWQRFGNLLSSVTAPVLPFFGFRP